MVNERLDDMLTRYGELCPQKQAAKILSVTPRTVARMMDDGRLRRVGTHVDVRSICRYIENPTMLDFDARVKKRYPNTRMARGDFYAASRTGKSEKLA